MVLFLNSTLNDFLSMLNIFTLQVSVKSYHESTMVTGGRISLCRNCCSSNHAATIHFPTEVHYVYLISYYLIFDPSMCYEVTTGISCSFYLFQVVESIPL